MLQLNPIVGEDLLWHLHANSSEDDARAAACCQLIIGHFTTHSPWSFALTIHSGTERSRC